ncbi:D-ribose transporter ATP-binding protein [Alkalispirochaeta sphaeroplastigenens]|uniref:Ribose/galactose/methyl galactoside import ATP-binding protein n=1 Tax=Alkalispirochaeta sphaeroplastigenens TaxID=1187066 RepID=A0A2S4JWZ7_9SPIO|nr:sugar ABC transporter ATP-binding protein [Alkalispirochaeta sphaeroplastigenens]POR04013.1 D-ribose transporter ATP-binding protein [Alkalispirochaeta sphaeroplastigenens]
MSAESNLLEVIGVVKKFPGVLALNNVSLEVAPGEIHALMGENGAGKSTLVKCIAGIQAPTSGRIVFKGEDITEFTPKKALDRGISMIHQELSPVVHRSIMENIWLGREPLNRFGLVDHKAMYRKTQEVLAEIDLQEDPRTLMENLSVAKMQMIEIAKAVSYDAKLIIMDEPTSALTDKEIQQLFRIVRALRDKGKSIIYISHKLEEIYEITDRVTVYRDGTYIGTERTLDLPVQKMINMMVGRDVDELFPKTPCPIGEVKLEVRNLSHARFFRDVSFTARRGEILGIAGLVGAGRTELIQTIFGIYKKASGTILIDGKEVEISSPKDAIKANMALLTEDRRTSGIFPMLSVGFNMTIASMGQFMNRVKLLSGRKISRKSEEYRKSIHVKTPNLEQKIMFLSGGNQQKVLVARWLMTQPDILFLDEPTRGIDVGTKAEIHRLISELAGQGKTIIMVSSELPEVMGMSDRILVMCKGVATGIVENTPDLTQDTLMAYATNTMNQETA